MVLKEMIIKIYQDKKSRNGQYSLRALARDLKIDVGQLNRIVNSKSTPSLVVAYRLGKFLNLNNDDLVQLIEDTMGQ